MVDKYYMTLPLHLQGTYTLSSQLFSASKMLSSQDFLPSPYTVSVCMWLYSSHAGQSTLCTQLVLVYTMRAPLAIAGATKLRLLH